MKHFYLLFIISITFSCKEKARFQLLDSSTTGIDFQNTITEFDSLHVMNFEYIYNGAGVGVVDLDNDDLLDIIFTGNQVPTKVYLNQGRMKFKDISRSFENLDNKQWYSGVSIVDINGDGWTDIYFTCTAHPDSSKRKNRFFINYGLRDHGELLFRDMAEEYGLADDSYGVQSAFFDYDLDGDLDMYLLNNYVNERLSAGYRERVLDGTAVSNDNLYRNNGDGSFTDVTLEAGILYEGFGLGLALGDVNKDGYTDLYISNDYVSNDVLYINQKDGTFRNEIRKYLSYQTKSSMGNDMADINNDGNQDIYTLDMMPENYYKKKQTINGFSYVYYVYDEKYGYEHQYLRNMLHLHNGFVNGEMIPYSEVGQIMGIYETEWSWSPLFADYDNDGDKDLLVANGFPKDLTDKDWTKYKSEVYGFVADEQHVMNRAPAVKAFNYAFENQGDLKFVKKSDDWFEPMESYSYGATFADLDNDGDLDYVINNTNDKAFVYQNTTVEKSENSSGYLRIKLKGPEGNELAFGAKVELWADGNYQFQENYLSRGYVSSVDPFMHFGLGDAPTIDSLRVIWLGDDQTTVLYDVAINQVLEIDINSARELNVLNRENISEYLFQPNECVIEYTHQQNDFIDFFYIQNILPHKFSQIGPIMTKGDLNNDGVDDLIIGSTNLLPTRIFMNNGGVFEEKEMEGLSTQKNHSEGDIAIIDFDADGDNDVISVSGGYESQTEETFKHYLYKNDGGKFIDIELPIAPFSSSVIRPFDYDHDNDLDLFIGARIKKDSYPLAADSWILINDNGQYRKEHCMNFNLGMVTDAVWSDFDGDGWEDLIIAREWNSIAIMKNHGGKQLSSEIIPEIDNKHGYWYSITSGDFDQDGDDDLILGNLGNNHRFHVSEKYPMQMYAVDADMNGTLDPIGTAFWKDKNGKMTEYPINYYDEIATQVPMITKKYHNYESFSYASFEDIFDKSVLDRVIYTFKMNTTTSYILWNEQGNFRWEALPGQAQLSPIKKTIVHDFNADGLPDVILAGNDHTFDVSTGYYDANKGLVLLSEQGIPLSKLLPPSESGLLLHGMVESLLYFDVENPFLIAGFNRSKLKTFSVHK